MINPSTQSISPVSRDQFLPLSLAQQRLWFLHQLEPDSANYNLQSSFRLSGFLNIQILEQALNEIVAHHEILRTSYIFENDNPRQIINAPQSVVLKTIDLEEYSETEQEKQIQQWLDEEAAFPFSLASDESVLRATLLRLSQQDHILQLVVHQIAADTFSMRIIWRQLLQIYKAYLDGATNPLPNSPIQFADFTTWKKQWLSGEVLNSQIKYWKKQLAGANPVLELPSDRPRPIAQTHVGATLSSRLSQTLSDSLRQFAHREGVTLYVTLLTALQILLYRYSGQEDITVGSPIAGRNFPQVTELIGFFVNTLVLRTDLSGNPTFQDLLTRVSTTYAEAEEHQDLPFKKLVEEMQIERSLSYNPLFQVMFSIETYAIVKIELPDLIAVPLYLENKTAKFDLDISVIEREEQELIVLWNYNTDLYNADTIARMSDHFQTLLTGIIANPQQSISQLPLLSPSELQQLLVEWNYRQINLQTDSQVNSQTNIQKYVHQLFEQQVEKSPEAIAVEFSNHRLTYRELNAKANQLAHYLRSLDVSANMADTLADTFVGICVERSLEMIVAILGILKAGAAYVPLDPSYPPDRLAYMIEDAKIAVLLTQEQERSQLLSDQTKVICLDSDWEKIAANSQENPTNISHIEDLAYVIYTSGSTGKPKGVMISHQALLNFTQTAISEYQITASDRLLQFASINFDVAVEEIFPCLSTGGTLVLRNTQMLGSLRTFLQACIDLEITVLNLPTAYFHQLASELANTSIGLPASLRMVIIGGEAALPEPIRDWQEYMFRSNLKSNLEIQNGDRLQLINGYGPTETTVTATLYKIPSHPITGEVPIGRPMPHLQTYILDRYLQQVPIGVSGELHIGGASLARGYLHRPELTAEKFIPNPFSNAPEARLYKTGDLARYRPDGNIEFLGRIDNQVKIRGFRIELGEIESTLIQSPIVREVAVTVNQDLSGNKRIFAYVVLHNVLENVLQKELLPNEQSPTNQLRSYLQNLLPKYMIPSVFIYLDDLPLTPSGKVDRRALAFLGSSEISNQLHESFVAPRDEVERQLAKIWTGLLNVNPIGIYDNFFDLGGHSLLSMRLVAAIEKTFKYQIPLKLLFQISTIAEIAEWIRERPSETHSTEDTLGLRLEDYRALLSHSAGKKGLRLGKRGLIISIPPEPQAISLSSGQSSGQLSSQFSIQPFVWIGEVKTGKRLKLKQPLYVMPGASLSSSMNSHKDYISTIASLLVDELLTTQPASSYALGGWCYNGLVAMEMAQQLIKLDKKVDLLTLIDMSGESIIYRLVHALNFYWGTLRFHLFNLANLSLKQKWQYIKDRLIKYKIISSKHTSKHTFLEGIEMEGKSEVVQAVDLLAKPVREYKPSVYNGRILLIIGNEQIVHGQRNIKHFDISWLFPRNGWGNLLQGEVFVFKLQCDHLDLMESPYCEQIGKIIQEIILPSQSRNSSERRNPAPLFLGFICLLL